MAGERRGVGESSEPTCAERGGGRDLGVVQERSSLRRHQGRHAGSEVARAQAPPSGVIRRQRRHLAQRGVAAPHQRLVDEGAFVLPRDLLRRSARASPCPARRRPACAAAPSCRRGTKALAATMACSPISASSITTAFMPTSAPRRTTQPCSTAPWPMWPSASTTVSAPGKPCSTQVSCTLAPAFEHDAAEVAAQAGAGADVDAGADPARRRSARRSGARRRSGPPPAPGRRSRSRASAGISPGSVAQRAWIL